MIDDDTLATHVRTALDAVEVPAGGVGRVLAARDLLGAREPSTGSGTSGSAGSESVPPRPNGRRRLPASSRWLLGSAAALVVLVVVAVAVVAGGHGAGTLSSKSSTVARAPALSSGNLFDKRAPASPSVGNLSGSAASIGAPPASAAPALPGAPGPPVAPGGPAGVITDRVVQTGSLTLTVAAGRIDATVAALGSRAAGMGGQVAKSQTVEAATGPSADLTLKVPAGSFTSLVGAVRNLGAATSVTTSATDVTASYVDLTARLNALEATRAQFLQILAKAQSIGDILAVEAQITPVQTQIEQLQGQQQVLADQTSFATLDVHVAGPGVSAIHTPPGGLSGAWAHARHAFASGIESIVSALGGFAVFLVCVAVLAGAGRIGWAVIRRRLV